MRTKYERMSVTLAIMLVLMIFVDDTYAITPPSPPTNVVCSISGTNITVNWNAPSSTPVAIADYRVRLYKNSVISIETFVKEPVHTVTFIDQLPATYEAHVRSRDVIGVMSNNSVVAKCSTLIMPSPTPIVDPSPTPTVDPSPTPTVDPSPSPTPIPDNTPPQRVSNLKNVTYESTYINWTWSDPTDSDFDRVLVYINDVRQRDVLKGVKYFNATGLLPNTYYRISTRTVDTSGNVNSIWKNNTARTAKKGLSTIRFVTIGDIHLTSNTSTDQYKRFTKAIAYINNRSDVDFVVQMGDIVDTGTSSSYTLAKSIMSKLKVPYYVLEGNHGSGSLFTKYFGKDEHMEYFPDANGYQMIFPAYNSGNWSFNYSIADKNRPTIIFNHGQVQPKPGGSSCVYDWGSYYSYACSMRPEVDKFTKLIGFYDGHVHRQTQQYINGTLFVSQDNIGGNGPASDYIGYTVIQNGVVTYSLLKYNV